MSNHNHDHDHDHSELDDAELRVRALETVLLVKGYIESATLDALIDAYQTKIGPRNGASVVARAWSVPAFREWLLRVLRNLAQHKLLISQPAIKRPSWPF